MISIQIPPEHTPLQTQEYVLSFSPAGTLTGAGTVEMTWFPIG
jgi:hypothetical protein